MSTVFSSVADLLLYSWQSRVTQSAPGHIVHCLSFHLDEPGLISLEGPAATEAS